MSYRLGTKIGKKSFVSFGKSGTYFSTWVGGWRVSKFTPTKSNKKETKKDDVFANVNLTNTYIGDTVMGMLYGIITYLLVVYFTSSIIWAIGCAFVTYWIWWGIKTYQYWETEDWSDKTLMFFTPFFSFFTIPGIVSWIVLLVIGFLLV